MASYTTNLNLKKPAGSENVAIGDINNNMDIIDNAYGTLNSKQTVYSNNYTLSEAKTIPSGGYQIIDTIANVAGENGAVFLNAVLLSGTTAGLAVLVPFENVWGSTHYLSFANPSGVSYTIPQDMVIQVRYAK